MHTIEAVWHVAVIVLGYVLISTAILNALLRRIPAATVARWEKTRPRYANALRMLRAGGADLSKFCSVLFCFVRGVPWPPAIDRIIASFLAGTGPAPAATPTEPAPSTASPAPVTDPATPGGPTP